MHAAAAITVFVAALSALRCSNSAPPSPHTSVPSGPVPIRATDRLTWDQTAASADELATIGYVLYVDGGTRVVLGNASCDTAGGAAGFVCRSPLPGMGAGTHTLELASFFLSAPTGESARSAPLTVTLAQGSSLVAEPPARVTGQASNVAPSAASEDIWPAGAVRLIDALANPADLAFTPDGRLWIAEQPGRIRVAHGNALVASPALMLASRRADGTGNILALAVDPQFMRTRFIFAIYTSRSRWGAFAFTIARFREASDTLADRVVILDDVLASSDPHASLRFGPDGKLYAAFDDGGNERLVGDAASFNGKVLRLNPDGTTPDDSPTKSPIFLTAGSSPRGLAWHRRSGRLWIAEALHVGGIDWAPPPTSVASAEDSLFVASSAGLTRAAIDARNPARLASIEQILANLVVRAVAVAPDGGVYFATDDSIGVVAR
jgi:glucose/arabinose dehydrogenase